MGWELVQGTRENEPGGDRKNSMPRAMGREAGGLDDGPEAFWRTARDQAEADARKVVHKWLATT